MRGAKRDSDGQPFDPAQDEERLHPAWLGSPHEFDNSRYRRSAPKGQAYGFGLYFVISRVDRTSVDDEMLYARENPLHRACADRKLARNPDHARALGSRRAYTFLDLG